MSTIEVGIMMRGQVRGILNVMKMNGEISEYAEVKYFLSSTFHLKGLTVNGYRKLTAMHKEYNKD